MSGLTAILIFTNDCAIQFPSCQQKKVQTACSLPASQASSALLCSVLFFFGILNDRPRFRQTHKEGCRFGCSCLLQLHSAETLECQSAKASSMPIDRSQKVKKKGRHMMKHRLFSFSEKTKCGMRGYRAGGRFEDLCVVWHWQGHRQVLPIIICFYLLIIMLLLFRLPFCLVCSRLAFRF